MTDMAQRLNRKELWKMSEEDMIRTIEGSNVTKDTKMFLRRTWYKKQGTEPPRRTFKPKTRDTIIEEYLRANSLEAIEKDWKKIHAIETQEKETASTEGEPESPNQMEDNKQKCWRCEELIECITLTCGHTICHECHEDFLHCVEECGPCAD